MTFKEAFAAMKSGCKVRLPEWGGHWEIGQINDGDFNTIIIVGYNCNRIDIRQSPVPIVIVEYMTRDDWEIIYPNNEEDREPAYMDFSEALKLLKCGNKLTRKGWNGKGMFIVYQKGYPDGVPCNKQTAEAWGLQEGDNFICNPYFQIKNVDGSHSMWVPSINDCLATDWRLYNGS